MTWKKFRCDAHVEFGQFNFLLVLLALSAHMTRIFSSSRGRLSRSCLCRYSVLLPIKTTSDSDPEGPRSIPRSSFLILVDRFVYTGLAMDRSPIQGAQTDSLLLLALWFSYRALGILGFVPRPGYPYRGFSWYSSGWSGNAGIVIQAMSQSSLSILMSRETWEKIYCGEGKRASFW